MILSSLFLQAMLTTLFMSTVTVMMSSNLVMAWIMLEINMMSFLPLIYINNTNQETEAAAKYFLVQALGSLLLLMSATMLFQKTVNHFAHIIVMMAMALKLGVAPCHFWYPSVMSSITWGNCMILSTWQKVAPLYLVSTFPMTMEMKYTLLIFASINALMGGVMGMNQTNLRRLMAYSSIGHMGWVMAAMALVDQWTWIIYFTTYCIMAVPVFMMFMLLNMKTIHDMYNTYKIHRYIPLVMGLLMLSMAGMPPLVGFMPKLMVITAMMKMNYMVVLSLLMGSYMNLYYYMIIAMSSMMVTNNTLNKYMNKVHIMSTMIMGSTCLLTSLFLMI